MLRSARRRRDRVRSIAAGLIVAGLIVVVTVAACDSDDGGDGDEITDAGEVQDSAAATGSDEAPSPTGGYDLPSDYPLPTAEGGTSLSALLDEASATSNVTVAYPLATPSTG